MGEVTVTLLENFQNLVTYGHGKTFILDEPEEMGGTGLGPDPYSLILAALGGCTAMTLQMYAKRKNWDLQAVTVHLSQGRIHSEDCLNCAGLTGAFVHRIECRISLKGDLTEEQRARLLEISRACPVHKTLTSPIVVENTLEPPEAVE